VVPGGGCTQSRDRVLDAELGKRHHVHISLDHDEAGGPPAGPRDQMQPIELSPLVKDGRLRRVQVLWPVPREEAPPEPDDATARVPDREHDSITETVVMP